MTADREQVAIRRYLLGESSERECARIETRYFASDGALERVAAAEDDLIEDYLDGRLPADQRVRFEQHYLAAASHRRRVEVLRAVRAAGQRQLVSGGRPPAPASRSRPRIELHRRTAAWLGMAAALVAAPVVFRLVIPRTAVREAGRKGTATTSAQRGSRGVDTAQVLAVTLSAAAVRGPDSSPAIVIPKGTTTVAIRLDTEDGAPVARSARAAIRRVAGEEVWQGAASIETLVQPVWAARIDVPADRLTADDYIVVLSVTDGSGTEQERGRYFLRVRER